MKVPMFGPVTAIALVLFGVTTAALIMALGPWAEIVAAFHPHQPFEVAPQWNSYEVRDLLVALGPDVVAEYRGFQRLDLVFALANFAALLGLGRLLLGPGRSAARAAWVLPAILLVLELIENLSLYQLLGLDPGAVPGSGWSGRAEAATRIKLLYLPLILGAFLIGTLLRVWDRHSTRSARVRRDELESTAANS